MYNTWVAENQKTYGNLVQAAYMDWVSVGKKEESEFAIIDNDSAMSHVENSKVSFGYVFVCEEFFDVQSHNLGIHVSLCHQ
jgi:hypothetical protein